LISIIEFVVYGFVAYSSLLMLIISVVKEIPSGKTQSILRSIWLIPGMIASSLLAGLGTNISVNDILTTENIINGTTGIAMTNSTIVTTNTINFVNPVWITFHWMIFLILLTYVIIQILNLLVKKD